jgi:hypothetical protein
VFAVLKASKELKTREQADFMYDLIGVVCATSGSQDYIDKARDCYREIRDNAVPEWKPEKVVWQSDGTPLVPWKQATQVLMSVLAVKKRIECGN